MKGLKGQSKAWSIAEAIFNSSAGFVLNVVVQIYVFRYLGINVPISSNITIAGLFFIIAIGRSFMVRRLFNWLQSYTTKSA